MYVELLQLTTISFPLDSVVFHPDGNSAGKHLENSGKQNPIKSPPEQRRKFSQLQFTTNPELWLLSSSVKSESGLGCSLA